MPKWICDSHDKEKDVYSAKVYSNGHFICQACYSGSSLNKALSILGIIAILIILTGIAQADDWPMFRHDLRHTGYTNENIPDQLELLWSYKTGDDVYSSPAVADGKVFVGSLDNRIYCLDANNGKLLWSYKTGGWVYSSPAVADGKVFVCSWDTVRSGGKIDNRIYCLDENTGKLLWSYETEGFMDSSPAVADGKVFVGVFRWDNSGIYCLDENTGKLLWSHKTGGEVRSSPAVADGKVFVGSFEDKRIYCLDANNGKLIWSYKTGGWVSSSPAVADGKVFVGSWGNKIYCLDENTGKMLWSYETGGTVNSPAVADGKVFVGSGDNKIYCLDANNGKLIWSYETGGWVSSSPAIADGKVFVGSKDNKIYCLDENNGKLIWSYETGGWVSSSPAIADGKVFVGSDDGKIYCFGFKPLYDALSSIDSAKTIGADTTEAEKLLQQAKSALNEKKYEDAKHYASQAKESAEKAKTMRLTLYGIVIFPIALLFIGYWITASRRERKRREELIRYLQEQRRKEYRAKRKELIYRIDELINDGSLISEKYTMDTLKKMREAIAHDNITEAEKYYKLLDEQLAQFFNFLK